MEKYDSGSEISMRQILLTVSEMDHWQNTTSVGTYTHLYCMCNHRFSPRGSAISREIPPVMHLGTHENGNGSGWSVDGDQSASSSGLFIKVELCPLEPVILLTRCHARPWGVTVHTVLRAPRRGIVTVRGTLSAGFLWGRKHCFETGFKDFS